MRTIKLLLAAGFLLVSGTSAYAQVQRNETYLPKFAIKTNALYWATSTPEPGDSKSDWQRQSQPSMYPATTIRGSLATTARSSTGSYNRNCATGSANVSTEVSSACTDTTEK